MRLAAEAWYLREAARNAIAAGDYARASELAARAQETQMTPAGAALRSIGEWLRDESSINLPTGPGDFSALAG
jgi:hypothetical protein